MANTILTNSISVCFVVTQKMMVLETWNLGLAGILVFYYRHDKIFKSSDL